MTVDIRVAADGTAVHTTHAEILATNAAGVMQAGQARVVYDSVIQTLDITDAFTLKKDGTRLPVDPNAIYDQLAPGVAQMPLFAEHHMKSVVFPQFEAGDTAIYTVRMTLKAPYFPGAFWYGELYPTVAAFDDVRETVTAPASLHLRAASHGVSVDRRESGGQTVFSWQYSAPEPQEAKVAALARVDTTPHVFVSSLADYAALGRAYAEAAAPKMVPTTEIRARAGDISRGTTDKREIAQKLYEWVSLHIRYVAVELGRGTLIPHDAQTVLANGYGDCKDHVTLLGALLAASGIRSEAVLLNGDVDYTLTEVPTFFNLNHVITYLPEFDIYLDSTALGAPFGVLPFAEYGKPIVHATSPGARRANAPLLQSGVAIATMKTEATLEPDGTLTGTTVTTANGPYAIELRAIGLGVQTLGPQESAARLMASLGYGSDATGTLDAPPPTAPGASYAINGRFMVSGWKEALAGKQGFYIPGGMRLLGILGYGMVGNFGGKAPEEPEVDRPCFSVSTTEEQVLHAPDNARFGIVPDDTHAETKYLTFDSHWTLRDNTLSVRRTFTSHTTEALCTAELRSTNEDALKRIGDDYDTNVWFKPANANTYKPAVPKVDLPSITLPSESTSVPGK